MEFSDLELGVQLIKLEGVTASVTLREILRVHRNSVQGLMNVSNVVNEASELVRLKVGVSVLLEFRNELVDSVDYVVVALVNVLFWHSVEVWSVDIVPGPES